MSPADLVILTSVVVGRGSEAIPRVLHSRWTSAEAALVRPVTHRAARSAVDA